ncbi:hypothetical protein SCATT_p02330 (plasmid) [Streptantibioticus cattleyicolor NRRL 8057 = DSM 46488]|uniref:Uncharacterized protein n=1 Tax=Streptantibioticus cattleyicolor (strain ATCC 35852 / DSM 46488 / JCM 4925 / NBRC 14057 / NRRL 8057) TaxID=1003195 RepID=G8XEX6_STREN|nr:hypothetical protein SCATT_p02330 [Streptantibioticus cattleyicolor NRRL 8057 = DSM 46488]
MIPGGNCPVSIVAFPSSPGPRASFVHDAVLDVDGGRNAT